MKIKKLVAISILGLATAMPVQTLAYSPQKSPYHDPGKIAYSQNNSFEPLHIKTAGQENLKTLGDIVLEHSAKNQVVMFGERHETYRTDNDFVAGLLPKLKEQGFNYLALEIERNPQEKSFHKIIQDYAHGKITREDIKGILNGRYIIREPSECAGTYDLIDDAKEAGMEFIFYDADQYTYDSWDEREEIAFNNLKELVFDKDPNAKVIIYCGLGHINEKPLDISKHVRHAKEIKNLGFYMNEAFKNKVFTISLIGDPDAKLVAPHCDLVIDLEKGEYRYN